MGTRTPGSRAVLSSVRPHGFAALMLRRLAVALLLAPAARRPRLRFGTCATRRAFLLARLQVQALKIFAPSRVLQPQMSPNGELCGPDCFQIVGRTLGISMTQPIKALFKGSARVQAHVPEHCQSIGNERFRGKWDTNLVAPSHPAWEGQFSFPSLMTSHSPLNRK